MKCFLPLYFKICFINLHLNTLYTCYKFFGHMITNMLKQSYLSHKAFMMSHAECNFTMSIFSTGARNKGYDTLNPIYSFVKDTLFHFS